MGDPGEEGPMRRYDDNPIVVPEQWPTTEPEKVPVPAEPVKEPVRTPA